MVFQDYQSDTQFKHHLHYASTPHLFVFQTNDDSEVADNLDTKINLHKKEPVYSSAYDVRKATSQKQIEAVRQMSERYDTLNGLIQRQEESLEESYEDSLNVTDDDIARIETFFMGYKTQIWVCRTMANLYFQNAAEQGPWQLRFTGVPLLLLDSGETKSRSKRQLQLIIAEKGTGFALWRDVINNLTCYKTEEPHFHTLYLSSDHRQRLGLSFNEGKLAMEFHSILDKLTSDPANISLSGPEKKKHKQKEKVPKYHAPDRSTISYPCNFQHVTKVGATDKTRFFSMQFFSRKSSQEMPPPDKVVEEKPPAIAV